MLVRLVALLLLALASFAPSPAAARPVPLGVVATTTFIAEYARTVGGGRVSVVSILPPNADPHTYEPVPGDVAKIAQADVVLVHGLGLDRWMDKVIANAGGQAPVYTVTDGITPRPGDEDAPEGDPHVWQNPQLVKVMVDDVAAALSAVDPEGADLYRSNAGAYKVRLDWLDRDLKTMIEEIPRENRLMVTNHDAFHYYTDHFGFVFIGSVIPGTTTESEASAGALGRLIRLMIDRHVNAVFTENTVESKIAQDIVNQTGAKVVAGLYSDALGEPGSPADTYEKMMRYNTRVIVDALK